MRRCILALIVALSLGCGAARHIAIQADATLAEAVFAVSSAALAACDAGTFTPQQCTVGGSVNSAAQQALVGVQAVTKTLQDAPTEASLPKDLPDLVRSLTTLQRLIGDLAPALPVKAELMGRVNLALDQVIRLLSAFTEVQ